MLANFAGISLAILIPQTAASTTVSAIDPARKAFSKSQHKRFFFLGALEVTGNVLGVLGLIFAGSGIFQVVYSSVVLFTALLCRIFLGRSPQPKQWIALFMITLGLAISAVGGVASISSPGAPVAAGNAPVEDTSKATLLGMFLTLISAIFYASSYVTVEYNLQDSADPLSERDIQAYAGLYGLLIIVVYTLAHTVPNWSTLVVENVAKKNGSLMLVFLAYATLALSSFLHSVSYYKLVRTVGAVSTGVLQSLRAVSVFGLSSLIFCGQHAEQCVTTPKIISMGVVAVGLYAYSHWALPKKTVVSESESRAVSA